MDNKPHIRSDEALDAAFEDRAPNGEANEVLSDGNPGAPQEPQLPLAMALLQQTRRVREQILPNYYWTKFVQEQPDHTGPKVNVDFAIMMMHGALTSAEQAMMDQNLGQMMFAHQQLATYQP